MRAISILVLWRDGLLPAVGVKEWQQSIECAMISNHGSPRYVRYVRKTLQQRVPAIIHAATEGQDAETVRQIEAIGRAVAVDAPMVLDLAQWPLPGWEALPARVNGRRPSEAAFFDFEHWLYFRILSAVHFAETGNDPFRPAKHRDLMRHLDWAAQAIQRTHDWSAALHLSLDANAHDLSQVGKPAGTHELGRQDLAIDPGSIRRINLIADNFGGEFVADLVLAVIAAEQGMETVVHVKTLPMFVSDTTMQDVTILLDRLDPATRFGGRLRTAIDQGRIRFAADSFWSAPLFLDRMPVDAMGSGDDVLNVLKGDLNFRRAIGDVVVPVDTPFEDLPILPSAPLLSLRSIKSYCVAGVADWPRDLPREDFATDGSIVAVQRIPGRAPTACA